MPSQKSLRVSQRKAMQNRPRRTAARTAVTATRKAIVEGDGEAAKAAYNRAASALDRAAKAGVIHPNNASRRKSRLAKQLHSTASNPTI
ncbi:MAG: 30S ribosomal protein S20 [Chloroflexi bacterium]|nr:30S ribosomal protein S20 [Chloroflexota bacterium]